MRITSHGQYGSVVDIDWDNVPQFSVLTGTNGVGKTQLLDLIASHYGALRLVANDHAIHALTQPVPENQRPNVSVEGLSCAAGEVFHSHSTWEVTGGGMVTATSVAQAIAQIPSASVGAKVTPWIIQEIQNKSGLSETEIRSLSSEEIEDYLTPALLWGHHFSAGQSSLPFLFLAYRLFERRALKLGKSQAEIAEMYGPPPWGVLNRIFEAACLPFAVIEPPSTSAHSISAPEQYTLALRDTQRDCIVPFHMLSSGERVIMATSLWHFIAQITGRHYKLLLLDEPDAHLHPSMTRRFLDVIQRVFVEERGAHVIMTTHSPSTVALVPESSLFEMRRTAPRIVPARGRTQVISQLTDGFVVVNPGMAVVLCEDSADASFYTTVQERLTDQMTTPKGFQLEKSPPLVFMHGKGLQTLLPLTRDLRRAGLLHFHALIDRDRGNVEEDGIHVIDRTALENYLFDPISVWRLLHHEGIHPNVPGVEISRGRSGDVSGLPSERLQLIVDTVLQNVAKHLTYLRDCDRHPKEISFVCGRTLKYPSWFLTLHKNQLKPAFQAAYPRLKRDDTNELITSFAALGMVPVDLYQVLRKIQVANSGTSVQ